MKKLLFILSWIASMAIIFLLQYSNLYNFFSPDWLSNIIGMIVILTATYLFSLFFFLKDIRKAKLAEYGYDVNAPFHVYKNGSMILRKTSAYKNQPNKVVLVNKRYKTKSGPYFDILHRIREGVYSIKSTNKHEDDLCGLIDGKMNHLTSQIYSSVSLIGSTMIKLQLGKRGYQIFSTKKVKLISESIFTTSADFNFENTEGVQYKIYCFKGTDKKWHMFDENGEVVKHNEYIEQRFIPYN